MFQPYHLTIILTVSQGLCSKVVIINMEAGCSAFNHITVTVHAHSFTSQRYITFYQTYTYDHNKCKTGKTKTYQLFNLTPFDGPTDPQTMTTPSMTNNRAIPGDKNLSSIEVIEACDTTHFQNKTKPSQ